MNPELNFNENNLGHNYDNMKLVEEMLKPLPINLQNLTPHLWFVLILYTPKITIPITY